jgi:dTDP-4-amino-4,6-dideoxygalactose transaminase
VKLETYSSETPPLSGVETRASAGVRKLAIPMIAPNPPRLSCHMEDIEAIERSGVYSNYGPVNSRFESALLQTIFTRGACVTVCNATIGLMLAIREVLGEPRDPKRRYALMPSFTFAATAHAALWNGLTPLFCDIDAETWLPCADAEEELLDRYRGEIAVVVPYATFGNNLDLGRYEDLAARHDVAVVVDAASSLGSLDDEGRAFGTGCRWPIVFSMHATKLFATGEGGVIYCGDAARIARLRAMGSFGFEVPRSATLLGLNSKLSEISALTALMQLEQFDDVVAKQQCLAMTYHQELSGWTRQSLRGKRQAYAFESVLLPEALRDRRKQVMEGLQARGIGCGSYFSPHLAEQPYFQKYGVSGPLPVTQDLGQRVLTLPMYNTMFDSEVRIVSSALLDCCQSLGN